MSEQNSRPSNIGSAEMPAPRDRDLSFGDKVVRESRERKKI